MTKKGTRRRVRRIIRIDVEMQNDVVDIPAGYNIVAIHPNGPGVWSYFVAGITEVDIAPTEEVSG